MPSPNFDFRRMEEKDLPVVCAIEKASFPNPWSRTTFMGEIQNRVFSFPYVIVQVQGDDRRVIGYVIFWKILDEVQVNNIAVHPDFRRRGIGEAVLRRVLESVRETGAKSIRLEVRPSNIPALALYRKLSFRPAGIRKDYYINPREDALVLFLALGQ